LNSPLPYEHLLSFVNSTLFSIFYAFYRLEGFMDKDDRLPMAL